MLSKICVKFWISGNDTVEILEYICNRPKILKMQRQVLYSNMYYIAIGLPKYSKLVLYKTVHELHIFR